MSKARQRSRNEKRIQILITMMVGVLMFAGPLLAFFPTTARTIGGLLGRSHQSITEDMYKQKVSEYFSITKLTDPMKQAMKDIADGDASVDSDHSHEAFFHVDGERMPEAHDNVRSLLNDVVSQLDSKDVSAARKSFGMALHTVQDFYAHSNWIEMGNTGPSQFGLAGGSFTRLPAGTPTCLFCLSASPVDLLCLNCAANLLPNGLTSGYYGGEPDAPKPNSGKCSHGGFSDATALLGLTGGINKDSRACSLPLIGSISPHFFLHDLAADAATQASKLVLDEIKQRVTPKELKALLGIGPSLVFAIDDTGSMADIIAQVQAQAVSIVNSRVGTPDEPSQYVLVPINDPVSGPAITTDDKDTFISAINSLFASGGDDCPELQNTGVFQGLSAADDGGDLFMFTDASSKDGSLAGANIGLAQQKDIKVYDMTFGSCSPIDPSYLRLTSESGGQLFFLPRNQAGNVASLVDLIARSNVVNIFSVRNVLSGTPLSYSIPIDALSKATFSISSESQFGSVSVVLKRPDGSPVSSGDPGVTFLSFPSGKGQIISITNPPVGAWSVTVNGSDQFSIVATGEGDLQLGSLRFVEPGGSPGHDGLFPINGLPVLGVTNTVDTVIDGAFSSAQLEMRSPDNTLLNTVMLNAVPESNGEFLSTVTLPSTPFRFYVTGSDSAGHAFSRVLPALTTPELVRVIAPTPQQLVPGQPLTYTFNVTNTGPTDVFTVTAVDDQKLITSVSTSSITVDSSHPATVSVTLLKPNVPGHAFSDTLTVSVESFTSGARNFAVVHSSVGNQAPDVSHAMASVPVLWPPNHKLIDEAIVGVTAPGGATPQIVINSITQDEPASSPGSGDTCPDGAGIGTSVFQLRAERDGGGNGRVYTITFTATANGVSSTGTVRVIVPHDSGDGAVDDGPAFNSTSCQ
jgi:uncharacterized repeat protein (TIGR01451 family)